VREGVVEEDLNEDKKQTKTNENKKEKIKTLTGENRGTERENKPLIQIIQISVSSAFISGLDQSLLTSSPTIQKSFLRFGFQYQTKTKQTKHK
jgi:hypothetical protein